MVHSHFFFFTECLKSLSGFSIFHVGSICFLHEGGVSLKAGSKYPIYVMLNLLSSLSNFQLYCLGCPSPWSLSGSRPVTCPEATIGLGFPFQPVGLWLASLPHGSYEVGQELCPSLVGSHLSLLCSSGLRPKICYSQQRLWSVCKWAPGREAGRRCPTVCSIQSGSFVSGVLHLPTIWGSFHVLACRPPSKPMARGQSNAAGDVAQTEGRLLKGFYLMFGR